MSHLSSTKQPSKESSSSSPETLDANTWKDYYLIIRERLFLGATVALLVSGLVGYSLMNRPAVYQSEAALLLESEGERVLDIQQVVETGISPSGHLWRLSLEKHINQLRSRSFRNHVVNSFSEEEKQQLVAPYLNDDEPTSLGGIVRKVEVLNIPDSFILQVSARHRDPEAAALLANRYVERYIDFIEARSQAGNQSAIAFLTKQEGELRERLDKAAEELQEYRRKHNLVSLEENQDIVAQRLVAISDRLTNAQMERLELESRLEQVERYRKEGRNLLEFFNLASLGSTPQAVGELDALRQEREVLSEKYGSRHPRMIANQRAIDAAEELIRENIDLAIADLQNQLNHVRETEKNLAAELREAENESFELDRRRVQYVALQRSVEGTRNTHAQIVDRLDETSISSQLETSTIRIFDRASTSSTPVQPNVMRIGMLVVFLCGFFFIGTPLGLAALDNKLKHAREVEAFLQEKLLGEISSVSNIKRKIRPHVVEQGCDDRAAEGFRGLFSELQLSSKNGYPKAIMTTSTIPGEGKSFLVNNLSYCFAAHGKRTLMVDFDLRRPSLHRFYSRLNNDGILPWLESEEGHAEDPSLEGLGIAEVAPNLFLLSSGGHTKKATETIGRPAIKTLLESLKKKFDVLMIDTPPLGIFPDALPLSQLVDESLYVAHFGMVDRQQVKTSLGRLKGADGKLLGVIMNGMPRGARFSHYYSGYGFGNYKYSKYYSRRN